MSAALPSFLAQTGPSAYTLTFSASGADMLGLCGMKYCWRYVTGIEAAVARAGQNFGGAVHTCCLKTRYEHMDWSLHRVEEEAEQLLAKWFAEKPQPELGSKGRPEWRTAARALQAFRAYNAAYPAEDFEVIGVEEPFEVELGRLEVSYNPTGQGNDGRYVTLIVIFRGIRDLRVRWHDSLWVLDHKTSTEWSDLNVDEGRASFQFQGYGWVERKLQMDTNFKALKGDVVAWQQLAMPVGGVIGNYLISRENYSNPDRKPTSRDLPRDQFVRQPYPYSDAELDEWHADAMDVAREIFERWQAENWPRRRTACAHWGRCEYYQLCWQTEPAYRLAAAMGADYRPRTPSPFEDEANGKRE